MNGEEAEWEGIEDGGVPAVPDDEEFVDEDKYTTVTVEAIGEPGEESEEDLKPPNAEREARMANGGIRAAVKKRIPSKDNQPRAKKKKFRYESKAERSATRQKQKSKNRAAMIRRKGG